MIWKKLSKIRTKRTKNKHKWPKLKSTKKRVMSLSHQLMNRKRTLVLMRTRKTQELMENKRRILDLTSRLWKMTNHPFWRNRSLQANLLSLSQRKNCRLHHFLLFSNKVMLVVMQATMIKYLTKMKPIA